MNHNKEMVLKDNKIHIIIRVLIKTSINIIKNKIKGRMFLDKNKNLINLTLVNLHLIFKVKIINPIISTGDKDLIILKDKPNNIIHNKVRMNVLFNKWMIDMFQNYMIMIWLMTLIITLIPMHMIITINGRRKVKKIVNNSRKVESQKDKNKNKLMDKLINK